MNRYLAIGLGLVPLFAIGCGKYTRVIHPEHVPQTTSNRCRLPVRIAQFSGPPAGELAVVEFSDDKLGSLAMLVEEPPGLIVAESLRSELEARGCDVQIVAPSAAPSGSDVMVLGRYLDTKIQQGMHNIDAKVTWEMTIPQSNAPSLRRKFGEVGTAEYSGFYELEDYEKATSASISASVRRAADAIQAQFRQRAQPAPATSTVAGCTADNQCKGDRVCIEGACTSPPTPGCRTDMDCAGQAICEQGQCAQP